MLLRSWEKASCDMDEDEDVGRCSLEVLVGVVAWLDFASRAW